MFARILAARPTSSTTTVSSLQRHLAILSLGGAPRAIAVSSSTTSLSRLPSSRAASSTTTTTKSLGVGSGVGGRVEKLAAAKEKLRVAKEKERAKVKQLEAKEKEVAQKLKAKKERERAKTLKDKEKKKQATAKAKAATKAKADKRKKKAASTRAAAAKPKAKRTRSLLHPPKQAGNTWLLFLEDYIAKASQELAPGEKRKRAPEYVKDAQQAYHDLSASDKAELLDRVQQRKEAYRREYDEWFSTLTPDMVREENAVRSRRRRGGLKAKKPLRLEGEPKKQRNAYLLFTQSCRNGENASVIQGETDVVKQVTLMAAAWRGLSAEDKRPFEEAAQQDKERYVREKAEFDAAQKAKTSAAAAV